VSKVIQVKVSGAFVVEHAEWACSLSPHLW
jgi:hypothetical protein